MSTCLPNRPPLLMILISACLVFNALGMASAQDSTQPPMTPALESQLALAGDNQSELVNAIATVPDEHREALNFLIANMSQQDLKELSASFLLENIRLAYRARAEANWKISDELFFNDVLPYANIDEPRDPWRESLYQLCRPIVKDCKTPGEAAQKLNATVFGKLAVKYSTKRKRANQSPRESIEQGLASCTGLSIILADACRSVAVPARLAGIPSWKNKPGNHTWVEIWDNGWHFTGAAEPDPRGLNHTWFQGDAALADPNSKRHSIYAVSFRKTETRFPMVWSPEKRVFAENVTARYVPTNVQPEPAQVSLMVRVWNADRTARQVAQVVIRDTDGKQIATGQSRAGTADMNDLLTFSLQPETTYQVNLIADDEASSLTTEINTGSDSNQLIELQLESQAAEQDESTDTLNASGRSALIRSADEYFFEPVSPDRVLREHPNAARQLAWERYLASPLATDRKTDFDKNQVTFEKHLSPYTVKTVGKRPQNGWPLFIAMHGGGGTAQRVNDSQWKHMQVYYRDQKQVTGYKYLALRAPNNTWNGFYDDYVYPLIENLIRQFIVFGDVDPDRVFLMGYSHGGYGAFAIGPKIPFRFAAVHASAAAPTDGQTSAKTLRNTRFTFMVGENDTAYGRRKRCEAFAEQIEALDYANVEFMFKPGFGHGGLPDRDMIGMMYDHVRNPVPRHLTWEMTDSVVDRFYWLAVDQPERGQLIDAEIIGNQIRIKAENCKSFSIFLDRRLIDDPDQPVELVMIQDDGERTYSVNYQPSFKTLCESIKSTGDPNLAFDFEIAIDVE